MGIFSGGSGGGTFNGGTITNGLFVNAASGIALEAKGGVADANILRLDTQAFNDVLHVGGSGSLFIRPESDAVPIFIQPRSTDVPAIQLRGMTAAPGNNSLQANDVTYWLDPTSGAAKFMVKAKDENGVVVTGSVNLT